MYNIYLTSPINIFDKYIKEDNLNFTRKYINQYFNTKIIEYFIISRVEPSDQEYLDTKRKMITQLFNNGIYSLNDHLLNKNLWCVFNFNWVPKNLKNIDKIYWKYVKINLLMRMIYLVSKKCKGIKSSLISFIMTYLNVLFEDIYNIEKGEFNKVVNYHEAIVLKDLN